MGCGHQNIIWKDVEQGLCTVYMAFNMVLFIVTLCVYWLLVVYKVLLQAVKSALFLHTNSQ